MEKHVVDLETAKKLKEYLPKGFECDRYWNDHYVHYPDEYSTPTVSLMDKSDGLEWLDPENDTGEYEKCCVYPAPILSEILELLPEQMIVGGKVYDFGVIKHCIYYESTNITYADLVNYRTDISACNLATAAALLYMWLIDNKHIEVNK